MNQQIINVSLEQLAFAKIDFHVHRFYTCFENDRPLFSSHSNVLLGKQSPGGWLTFTSPLVHENPIDQALFGEYIHEYMNIQHMHEPIDIYYMHEYVDIKYAEIYEHQIYTWIPTKYMTSNYIIRKKAPTAAMQRFMICHYV